MKKQKGFHVKPWEIGAIALGLGGLIWWMATRNKTPGGSADTKLSTLSVIPNGTLSPAFSPATLNYTATVPAFVTTCTVTYTCEKPSDVMEVGIVKHRSDFRQYLVGQRRRRGNKRQYQSERRDQSYLRLGLSFRNSDHQLRYSDNSLVRFR